MMNQRSYIDLIKDLKVLTNECCCDEKSKRTIIVNQYDLALLDAAVEDASKGHQMYGIFIELGDVDKPTMIRG